jgi:hypothetical protein
MKIQADTAERNQKYYQGLDDRGLIRRSVICYPEDYQAIKSFVRKLRDEREFKRGKKL